jgi:hypothetical protein
MLREMLDNECEKSHKFQVMLLNNDKSDEVEVHETDKVDFIRVLEHLTRGGSVFITSKNSQKLPLFNLKRAPKRKAQKTVTAFYFDHV